MLLHFRFYAALAVIVGGVLFAGNVATAEWTEPVLHAELNNIDGTLVASQPCISSDGLSIFYRRRVPSTDGLAHYLLFEAVRDDVSGVFTSERGLWELNPNSVFTGNPWISRDGLRLYYGQAGKEGGQWGGYMFIKMASRNSPSEAWHFSRTLSELHMPFTKDSGCTLTEDELIIMWTARRPTPDDDFRMYMATRASVAEPFSNVIEVTELNEIGAHNPHLSGDGLRVYFSAPRPDNGRNNIYMMTRPSLSEPFGNIEHLDGVTDPDAGGSSPHLSPDEKTIYIHGRQPVSGDGIKVSYWIDDPYEAAVESIEAAIAAKREAIAVITSGLDKDREVLEALNELGETGDIDPAYIEGAKKHVLHAIKRQMKAIAELEKSIRELEKALEELEGMGKPGKPGKRGKPVQGPEKLRPRRIR